MSLERVGHLVAGAGRPSDWNRWDVSLEVEQYVILSLEQVGTLFLEVEQVGHFLSLEQVGHFAAGSGTASSLCRWST